MIELINIQKSYPTQTLYQDLNLRLNKGDKVGLVGRNGTGKSTLLNLFLEKQPDSGDIVTQNYKIGALKQYFDFKRKLYLMKQQLLLMKMISIIFIKLRKYCFGLGFSRRFTKKKELKKKSFSGGYQIRINL